MKNRMSITSVLCLGFLALNAHAAQESYGLPSGEQLLMQCDVLRNADGGILLGSTAPLIVEKDRQTFVKTEAIVPHPVPHYVLVQLLDRGPNTNELNYRSEDNVIALTIKLDAKNNPESGEIHMGIASAHCNPVEN